MSTGMFGLQRPFTARRKNTEDMTVDAAQAVGGGGAEAVSQATRVKADAAKQFIENMYKVQHQNIQERYAR